MHRTLRSTLDLRAPDELTVDQVANACKAHFPLGTPRGQIEQALPTSIQGNIAIIVHHRPLTLHGPWTVIPAADRVDAYSADDYSKFIFRLGFGFTDDRLSKWIVERIARYADLPTTVRS